MAPKDAIGHLSLESVCVTLAKGNCPRGDHVTIGSARLGAAERRERHERLTRKELCNNVAKFSACEGQVAKAERWLRKLDGEQNCGPEVGAFNAFILAATRANDLTKAEEWFTQAEHIGLHPELTGLEKNLESYDIMISAFANAGDIPRAEKYAREAEAVFSRRPALATLCAMVRAAIAQGEPRRAHLWMDALVKRGCSLRPNYEPQLLKAEREQHRSRRTLDVDALISLVISLVDALAGSGNAVTANNWLRYLSESGLRYDEAPDVWERVRKATPEEIVPTVLSGESLALQAPPSPAFRQPATLSGEKRLWTGTELQVRGSSTPEHGLQAYGSKAQSPRGNSRPGTSQGLVTGGRISQLSNCTSPSRAQSPALRKMLDARTRGATPTLSGLGSAGGRWSR
eukprot:TRINITY_DN30988_c0_g1_i1.p1 TRINITY_DN30988_c0_g1~~TRINITY_DN30988_c0_g1_i1.p1  ORF type:complete len:414 (+),score=62.54 TRINITY_DN30988_c0_g1_i1:42-1244(+)